MMAGFYPWTYKEPSLDPIFKKPMKEEFKCLQDNETWELVSLPSKRKLEQCKWVYRKKMVLYG